MKINLTTALLVAVGAYLLLAPKTATIPPILDETEPDVPVPGDDVVIDPVGGNQIDVYQPDATGNMVYHHTEITAPDGTVGVYMPDATGQLVFVKNKKNTGNTQTTTVAGIGRTRSYGSGNFYIAGRNRKKIPLVG